MSQSPPLGESPRSPVGLLNEVDQYFEESLDIHKEGKALSASEIQSIFTTSPLSTPPSQSAKCTNLSESHPNCDFKCGKVYKYIYIYIHFYKTFLFLKHIFKSFMFVFCLI